MKAPGGSIPVTQYSHGHQPSVLAAHGTRTALNSCAYFLDRLHPGMSVLDIGCGPGSITLDLAERVGPTGSVTGVDFSRDAVQAARADARERGVNNANFVVGDLFSLDRGLGPFDVVHAHQVLQHVSDPVGALQQMRKHAKPGGIVVARDADYGAMVWFPQTPGLDLWRTTYTAAARARGAEPDAGRRLRQWANSAGLEVVSVSSSTWTYATPETAAWWGNSQADRVRNSNFATQAAEQGLSSAQIEEIATAWEEWAQDSDAWFCVVNGELIASAG